MMESDDEEKNMIPKTCIRDATMDEEEKGMELVRPRTKMGSNYASNAPKEVSFT
jgi:hypothetical protein